MQILLHGAGFEAADSPVSRSADVDKDLTSLERCLDDSVLLLAEQQVGAEKMWLLPQTQWQEGETLRQTAERALASLPGNQNDSCKSSAVRLLVVRRINLLWAVNYNKLQKITQLKRNYTLAQ